MRIIEENSGEQSDSMFRAVARAVKKRTPALYEFMKQIFRRSKVPVLKVLNGKFILTAPDLIGARPTEPHVLRWINELLRPGDTFFDVGAHYGWMSLVACRRVGTRGKVVAFEPSPKLVNLLQYNKRINRFRQMEIVSKAVADSDHRLVPFYLVNCGDSFLNSLLDHRIEPAAGVTAQKSLMQVDTITLDEFCKMTNLHPNAVKIDVEGAELLALQGCIGLLKKCRTVFIVAVHPTWLAQGQKAVEIFDLFRAHGYKVAASNLSNMTELTLETTCSFPTTRKMRAAPLRSSRVRFLTSLSGFPLSTGDRYLFQREPRKAISRAAL